MIDTEKYVKIVTSPSEKPKSVSGEIRNEEITITSNGVYTPSEGYTGIGKATVNVPQDATLTTKSITENGTYNANSDDADGYSRVTVAVPNGTESLSVTSNGTYTPSGSNIGFNTVTVNVSGGGGGSGTITFVNNGTYDVSSYANAIVNVPNGTETLTATANGTYTPTSPNIGFSSVNVNIAGADGKYLGLDVGSWCWKVNQNGELYISHTGTPNFAGVKTLNNDYLQRCFYNWTEITGIARFDDLETITDSYSLYNTFYGCSGITGISFAKLQSITGSSGYSSIGSSASSGQATFYGTALTSFYAPLLTTISSNYTLTHACHNLSSLTSVDLGSLTTVSGNYSLYYAFCSCGITSLDISNLTTVSGTSAMYDCFAYNSSLTGTLDLSHLTTVSGSSACEYAFYQCTGITSVDLSSLANIGNGSCASMFDGCSSLAGTLSLPSLVTIQNDSACSRMFSGTHIVNANLSNLTTINGEYACSSMFSSCSKLVNANLSSLTSVSGNYACSNMFNNCSRITSNPFSAVTTINSGNYIFDSSLESTGITALNFNNLQTVNGTRVFYCIFGYKSSTYNYTDVTSITFDNLTTASGEDVFTGLLAGNMRYIDTLRFPSLTTISGEYTFYGLNRMQNYTSSNDSYLKKLYFDSLSSIDGYRLFSLLARNPHSEYSGGQTIYTYIEDIYFYALTPSSFGQTYTDQFYTMLTEQENTKVHFPMSVQSTIGNWSDVLNGFGGTNITVLFDLVQTLTGADNNTYTRYQKGSTNTYTCWKYNDTTYYTSGTSEPSVSDTIYSDSACTNAVTTVSAIA